MKDLSCVFHTFEGPGPPNFDQNPSKNQVEIDEAFSKPFLLIFDRFGPPFWVHFCPQKSIQNRNEKRDPKKNAKDPKT